MVPIGGRTYFLLDELLSAQMAMDILLCVSFCHSTFRSYTDDKWTGLISAYETMVFPEEHGTRLPFLPHGSGLRRLLNPL